MSKRERMIWIFVLFVTITISVIVIGKYQTTLKIVDQKLTNLEGEKTSLTLENMNLRTQLDTDNEAFTGLPENDLTILNALKRKGLNGPNEVKDDLLKHVELIPVDGVLGGQMGYGKIFVISDKWVVAQFEDGHIIGTMLLSFRVENGNITWKVIDSYLFGN